MFGKLNLKKAAYSFRCNQFYEWCHRMYGSGEAIIFYLFQHNLTKRSLNIKISKFHKLRLPKKMGLAGD